MIEENHGFELDWDVSDYITDKEWDIDGLRDDIRVAIEKRKRKKKKTKKKKRRTSSSSSRRKSQRSSSSSSLNQKYLWNHNGSNEYSPSKLIPLFIPYLIIALT